jgi:homogentisate 1,2-dioxygenase
LLEHSPFCERDLKVPTELETHDEKGEFLIKIKKENVLHEVVYATHPFDVVGWDGYNFPYAFSIHNQLISVQFRNDLRRRPSN